jgi:hypothetical protein
VPKFGRKKVTGIAAGLSTDHDQTVTALLDAPDRCKTILVIEEDIALGVVIVSSVIHA